MAARSLQIVDHKLPLKEGVVSKPPRKALGTLSNSQINTQQKSTTTNKGGVPPQKSKSFTIAPKPTVVAPVEPIALKKPISPEKDDDYYELEYVHGSSTPKPFDIGLDSDTIERAISNCNKGTLNDLLNRPPTPIPLDDLDELMTEDPLYSSAKATVGQASKILDQTSGEDLDLSGFVLNLNLEIDKMVKGMEEEKVTSVETDRPRKASESYEKTPLMTQSKIQAQKELSEMFVDEPERQSQPQQSGLQEKKKVSSSTSSTNASGSQPIAKQLDADSIASAKKKGLRPANNNTLNTKVVKTSNQGASLVKEKPVMPVVSRKSSVPTPAYLDKENVVARKPVTSNPPSTTTSTTGKSLAYRLR